MELSTSPTFYSFKDDPYVAVTIIDAQQMQQSRQQDITLPKDETQDTPVEDVDSLFESVETEKITYSKNVKVKEDTPVVDPEFLKKIQTRKEIKHDTARAKQQKIKDLDLEYGKFQTEVKSSPDGGGEKNEYYAKIHQILYRNWYHKSEIARRVVVRIKISPSGTMTYRIKQVSGDVAFDESVKSHLEYLLDQSFPPPPNGSYENLTVNFKSKEE